MSTVESMTLSRTGTVRPEVVAPPRLEFRANLDILRSIAVLLVLLDHVLGTVSSKHANVSFHGYDRCVGLLGVLLFFVHTSLVLNFSLARLDTHGWALWRTFLVRRAFRLYPLSMVCVLVAVTFHVPAMPFLQFSPYTWGGVLSNLALTANLTATRLVLDPLWSLPIEAQMYVALPVIFMLLGATRSPRIALGVWLVACTVAWMYPSSTEATVIDFAPCFIAGIVAYTLSGWYPKRLPGLLWIPFLLAMVGGFVIIQDAVPNGFYNTPLEWVFCLSLGITIPLFHDTACKAVNYAAGHVARYSYGIYLFHCIALWIGCRVLQNLPEPLQWTTAAVLTGAMSVGSYHLVEKPAIDFGARLTADGAAH